MARLEPAFPDAENLLIAVLTPIAPVVTSTPDPILPPLIRVQRVGGADDRITDFPRVEVAVYGSTRPQAWQIAEQCRQVILASRRTTWTVDGQQVLVDGAETVTPAAQVPYENPDLRRVVAIYQVWYRRPLSV